MADDLMRYARERAKRDPRVVDALEIGYPDFKLGVLLRQARENAGLTQEEVAERLNTKKSAISRIENHAGDIRLSTLRRYARAVGLQLAIEFVPFSPAFPDLEQTQAEEASQERSKGSAARRRASI